MSPVPWRKSVDSAARVYLIMHPITEWMAFLKNNFKIKTFYYIGLKSPITLQYYV